MEELPIPVKMMGAGTPPGAPKRHFDELWLVLIQPKSKQDQVCGLKVKRGGTAGAVVKDLAIQ
jgi:hypothetical protein